MSDLEKCSDDSDETYIPPELENESDCDKIFDDSDGCGSIEQMKDNKNDNDEDISTEKLTESQNREPTDSSAEENVTVKPYK